MISYNRLHNSAACTLAFFTLSLDAFANDVSLQEPTFKIESDTIAADVDVVVPENGFGINGKVPFVLIETLIDDILADKKTRKRAFEIIDALKVNYEGELRFDELYGELALEFGDVGEALYALSRVLVRRPGDEFFKVLFAQAQAKSDTERKLIAYQQRRFKGMVTLGWIHDSNINSGTELKQFYFPAYDFVLPLENLQKRSDQAYALANRLSYQITPRFLASLNTKYKMLEAFDNQLTISGRLSYAFGSLQSPWLASLVGQYDDFDGEGRRDSFIGSFAKAFQLGKLPASIKLFSNAMLLEYDERSSDKIQYLVGAGLEWSPNKKWLHQLNIGLSDEQPNYSKGDAEYEEGSRYARDSSMINYNMSYDFWGKHKITSQLGYKTFNYKGFLDGLLETRVDETFNINVSYSIQLTNFLSTVLSYRFVDNTSNIELYDFEKHLGALAIAYRY